MVNGVKPAGIPGQAGGPVAAARRPLASPAAGRRPAAINDLPNRQPARPVGPAPTPRPNECEPTPRGRAPDAAPMPGPARSPVTPSRRPRPGAARARPGRPQVSRPRPGDPRCPDGMQRWRWPMPRPQAGMRRNANAAKWLEIGLEQLLIIINLTWPGGVEEEEGEWINAGN